MQAAKTLTDQIATLGRQLTALDQALGAKQQEIDRQNATIADLGQRLNVALANKVEELSPYRSDFFGRLRQALGGREDIRIVGDRFVFQSEVLFRRGSADINAEGRSQARQARRRVQGDRSGRSRPTALGAAGRRPHRPAADQHAAASRPTGSCRPRARSRSSQFLVSQGIPPDRVAARGFAEFQPLDPGEGEDAYRRNRRIEIKLTTR